MEATMKRVLIKTFNSSHLRPPNDDIITSCPLKRIYKIRLSSIQGIAKLLFDERESLGVGEILNALSFRLSPFQWAL